MTLQGNIVGVDPGKATGLVIFSPTGQLKANGIMTMDEMIDFTDTYSEPVAVVIVEDFITFKKRALQQAGSRQHASQVIGMMKVFARKKRARFVLQPAERKEDGAALSQKFPPSNHAFSHDIDAFNHAFWWMHQAGIVKSALERERLNG